MNINWKSAGVNFLYAAALILLMAVAQTVFGMGEQKALTPLEKFLSLDTKGQVIQFFLMTLPLWVAGVVSNIWIRIFSQLRWREPEAQLVMTVVVSGVMGPLWQYLLHPVVGKLTGFNFNLLNAMVMSVMAAPCVCIGLYHAAKSAAHFGYSWNYKDRPMVAKFFQGIYFAVSPKPIKVKQKDVYGKKRVVHQADPDELGDFTQVFYKPDIEETIKAERGDIDETLVMPPEDRPDYEGPEDPTTPR